MTRTQLRIDCGYAGGVLPTDTSTQAPGTSPIGSPGDVTTLTSPAGLISYLHTPTTGARGELVIVHQGHDQSIGNGGVKNTSDALLENKYDVLLCAMPDFTPNGACGTNCHNSDYTVVRDFVDQIIAALNTIAANYNHISATGISGGGWTIDLAAAIDTRITIAIEISGSLPIPYRVGVNSVGDWEQQEIGTMGGGVWDYDILYEYAADANRKFVQCLNPNDSCCFGKGPGDGGAYGDTYQEDVIDPIQASLGSNGTIRWYEDETIPDQHAISTWAINNVILPELVREGSESMAIIKWTAGTVRPTGISATTLGANAGVLGSGIDNSVNKDRFCNADLIFSAAGAPAAGDLVWLFFLAAMDGTNYEDGGASVFPQRQPDATFVVRQVTGQQRINLSNVPISPYLVTPLLWNSTTQGFTGVSLDMKTHNEEIV